MILLTITSAFLVFLGSVSPAHAQLSIATNTGDTYRNQNWIGLRPKAENVLMNYQERVLSYQTDGKVEAMLGASVDTLLTGISGSTDDEVKLGFILNANSRVGISYSLNGPTSYSYSIPSQATTLTIVCGHLGCGQNVSLTNPVVFYGAPNAGGVYDSIFVSENGYVSVLAYASSPSSIGPGIIAAFSRPLYLGQVSYLYDSSRGDSYIFWNNMVSANGNLESFAMVIRDWSSSPYKESAIEFWYNSVTSSDGVSTAVGMADQYGGRMVSLDLTRNSLTTNQKLSIQATNGPYYINSFSVVLSDTINGAQDHDAKVVLSDSTNCQCTGNPVGYNINFQSTVPYTVVLPDYVESAMALGSFLPGEAGLLIGAGGSAIDFGVNTYNALLTAYYTPQLYQEANQGGGSGSYGASPYAYMIGYGAGNNGGTYKPTDASLGSNVFWWFRDTGTKRTEIHDLAITATVGYVDASGSGSGIGGPDQYTVSTTMNFEFDTDYLVGQANFPNSGSVSPLTTPTGAAQWVATNSCPNNVCFEGQYSAWSGTASNGEAEMDWNFGNFVGYNQIVVYPHIWISSIGTLSIDYLSSGMWHSITSYQGYLSSSAPRATTTYPQAEWISPRFVLPSTATALRFMMPAGVAGNGAYVDEVFLFGDGPGNSADTEVLGETIGLVPISAPISMDGITYYASPDHFLASLGTLTVYAQTSYTDNTGTYQFRQWSNGVTSTSTSVTVAFDGGGTLYAEYSYVSDFTITPSNIYFQVIHGDSDQQLVLTLTSRNGFAGSIALTSSASPSGLSYSLSNNSVVLASGGTSTVTITVNSSSSVGTYTLVVTGTGNSIVRTATFTVGIVTSGGDGCSPIHGASRMSPDTLRC